MESSGSATAKAAANAPPEQEVKGSFRLTPADKDLFAVRTYLKTHPPSLAFNQRIWTWFFSLLK